MDLLTITGVTTRLVNVPLRFALGTSAARVTAAPLLLVDLHTREGVTGRTYLFTYRRSGGVAIAALLQDAVEVVKGMTADPVAIGDLLARRFALLGVVGAARMALAALDMGIWDANARAAGLPLAAMLGASPRPVPAYNSSGLGLMPPEAAADEAEALLEGGFKGVKLRLGHPTLREDLAVLRAVRNRLPDEIAIMVDYNQALTVADAMARGRAIETEGIYWIEEPIRHDDWAGNRALADALEVPLQIGENFDGPRQMADAISAGAADWVMPDAVRIGGVTGWIHAAGIAAARGLELSSHLLPEISAHLLCATPTAHWLEYVDWADAILVEPPKVVDGAFDVPNKPGIGLEWDEAKISRLIV
ncbi:mandelate racemase [bacterium SCSIO 12827]|nr:mandelate racemase [bacterium SCSIO 12827]